MRHRREASSLDVHCHVHRQSPTQGGHERQAYGEGYCTNTVVVGPFAHRISRNEFCVHTALKRP